MTPIFKVTADGGDITAKIAQRLINLKTTDEAGVKSDSLNIDLDDRDGLVALPRRGAKLEVWLGYAATGLVKVGAYAVDEVSLNGPPSTLSITAKAADMTGNIKEPKTRSFDNVTLGDIVQKVAGEHGLVGAADGELGALQLPHLDQTAESDMHLLTRLAKQYGGVAKVSDGHLIVTKLGAAKGAGGAALPAAGIGIKQASDWRFVIAERSKYGAVKAAYHNKATGKRTYFMSGSTDENYPPVYVMRHAFDTQQQAQQAAQGKKAELDKGKSSLEITLAVGDPSLFAETPLALTGWRSEITQLKWVAKRVEHQFSAKGFTTTLAGEGSY